MKNTIVIRTTDFLQDLLKDMQAWVHTRVWVHKQAHTLRHART
jgi:hypothetical protein